MIDLLESEICLGTKYSCRTINIKCTSVKPHWQINAWLGEGQPIRHYLHEPSQPKTLRIQQAESKAVTAFSRNDLPLLKK